MILTGKKIRDEIRCGTITVEPFDIKMINPNSVNYRLGRVLYEVLDDPIDPKVPTKLKKHVIGKDGFVLKPGRLYLGSTMEKLGSSRYVTSLIGRSSIGRLGIFVQVTADLGNLGSAHAWTLEIKAVQEVRVYAGMKIGQVSFWEYSGSVDKLYKDGYTSSSVPEKSNFHQELRAAS